MGKASSGQGVDMRSLAEALRTDPEIQSVTVRGLPEKPTVLVVAMSPQRADRLREEHSGELIVEPDRKLRIT